MNEQLKPSDPSANPPKDKYAETRVHAQKLLGARNSDGTHQYTIPQIRDMLGLTRGQYSHMMREVGSRTTRLSPTRMAEITQKLPDLWNEKDEQGKPKYSVAEIEAMFGMGRHSLNGVLEDLFKGGTLEPRHQRLPKPIQEKLIAEITSFYHGDSPDASVASLRRAIEVDSNTIRRYEKLVRANLDLKSDAPKLPGGRPTRNPSAGRSRTKQPARTKSAKPSKRETQTGQTQPESPRSGTKFPKITGLTELEQTYVDAVRAAESGDPTSLNELVRRGYPKERIIRIAEQYKDKW